MAFTEIHWSMQAGYPLLATLQLLPLLAAAALLLLRNDRIAPLLGMATAIAELLVAVDLYRRFDHTQKAMQFAEQLSLSTPFNYHVAVDGVSVLFMLLAAVLGLMVVIYGRIRHLNPPTRFLATVLAVLGMAQGLFATVDLLWFTLLSAFELALIGYLLSRWATSGAEGMAMRRYMQFMGTGLVLLLLGTLLLGWNHATASEGVWSFDLARLLQAPVASAPLQSVIFFLLFYGLAIRTPLFPLHGWLPLIAEHGTVAVSGVFLIGLKVGVYGLLRFVFPLLSDAVLQWHNYVVAFATAGIFYAALLAFMQLNLRRLLAFAVVSHTSVLVIGLFSLSHTGFQGSVLLAVNFGLAITGLLFMTGLVFRRTHTLLLPKLGGLFDRLPFIGIAFLVAGLSIIGMPGTPGFDAAHLMMEAAIVRFGALITIAAALGNVAAAGFLLWAFQRAFLAPAPPAEHAHANIEAITPLEMFLAGAVLLVLLGVGFYGEPWLDLIDVSLQDLGARFAAGTEH